MNAPFPVAADCLPARRDLPVLPHLQIATIIGLAVIGRAMFWNVRPPDMTIFLEPWFAHIVHYGSIGAFAHPFSNYEPAYLYLLALGTLADGLLTQMTIIKIISLCGTLFLTLALADLLKAVGTGRLNALLLLVLPSVIFNDALLAQCDALWAGACVFALAQMIRGRTLSAMVWCGVGFAFKAQAAFIAPVIVGAMIGRRAPWWHWFVPGLVFVATLVPAWLMGWPALKLLTVYLDQAAWVRIPGRLANPWMVGTMFADHAARNWFALGYAAAGAAALVIMILAARAARNPRALILLAALAGTALPFLLPKMLERYYFLGDVMTLALVLSHRSRPAFYAMCAVQLASILSHITLMYFFYQPYPALVGALFAAAGLALMGLLAAPQLTKLLEFRFRSGVRAS
jgi:Gpi18-like mannosyltransferase